MFWESLADRYLCTNSNSHSFVFVSFPTSMSHYLYDLSPLVCCLHESIQSTVVYLYTGHLQLSARDGPINRTLYVDTQQRPILTQLF
jgi:hypothetical protein